MRVCGACVWCVCAFVCVYVYVYVCVYKHMYVPTVEPGPFLEIYLGCRCRTYNLPTKMGVAPTIKGYL